LKIVMLSSAGLDVPSVGLARLGVSRWLAKPVRKQELRRALIDLVGELPPPVQHAVASPRVPAAVTSAGRGVRILLAEDHPVNQEVAAQMLRMAGYEVHIVGDGDAAVAAARTGQFDLVLMDCLMPGTDGFEATARLREEESLDEANPGRRLPIVALTANAMKGDVEACLAAGMDDYVPKPFTQEQLISVIERRLRNKV
jgi:CheY-like chemotaxis protein